MGSKKVHEDQQTKRKIIPRARAVAWASTVITEWQRERIIAAGGDPSIVPDAPFRFVRLPEVKQLTGLSRSSLYRMVSEARFPAPVPLCAAKQGTAR
jgi:predicted DNA-binding transcriptional regulator AlpA